MSEGNEWDAMIGHFSAGTVGDFDNIWRRLQGVCVGTAHKVFCESSPVVTWERLPASMRRLFSTMLTSDARRAYGDLGYDLSFVPEATPLDTSI